MDAEQIKAAVDAGKTVHWMDGRYRVKRDSRGQYLIHCETGTQPNCWGLTHRDGETLNGHPNEFYTPDYLSLDRFTHMYLDYVNNFITVERFASHYDISERVAREIIEHGRAIHSIDLDAE